MKEEEKEKEREGKADRVSDLKKDYTVCLYRLLDILQIFLLVKHLFYFSLISKKFCLMSTLNVYV